MLLSTLHAWLSITVKADQIISGTVINILALGGTAFFNQLLVSTTGLSGTNTLPKLSVPNEIATIPFVGPIIDALFNQGPIAMSLIVFVVVLQVLLFRSRWGLRTRAVGEHPQAADTVGIDVDPDALSERDPGWRLRRSGRRLPDPRAVQLVPGQHDRRRRVHRARGDDLRPLDAAGAYGAALLFGTVQSMQLAVRISPPAGDLGQIISTIPPQVFGMLPYIFTIIVLAGVVGRAIPPAADGIPYDKEARG